MDDFDAEEADEVAVLAGAEVIVLATYDDGWAMVEVAATGTQGMLPLMYIEYLEGALAPTPVRPPPAPAVESVEEGGEGEDERVRTSVVSGSVAWAPPRGVSRNDGGRGRAGTVSKFAMSGWMETEGKPGKWKRKWYVLEGQTLASCRNPSALKKRSPIVTFGVGSAAKLMYHKADPSAPPVLELTTKGTQKLYLRTSNADEAELWLAAIETAIYGVSSLSL